MVAFKNNHESAGTVASLKVVDEAVFDLAQVRADERTDVPVAVGLPEIL